MFQDNQWFHVILAITSCFGSLIFIAIFLLVVGSALFGCFFLGITEA